VLADFEGFLGLTMAIDGCASGFIFTHARLDRSPSWRAKPRGPRMARPKRSIATAGSLLGAVAAALLGSSIALQALGRHAHDAADRDEIRLRIHVSVELAPWLYG
jgi:hypothetical protein